MEANREVAVEVSREEVEDQEEVTSNINNKEEEEDNTMEVGRTEEEGNTILAPGCR